ncbi:ATP-binding cassette domain-containing protein [Paramaledivibacter caminithermalis]|jgi:ABC-type lipoprotein export system ATPase subunit|uniref:ABC-type lipoprotein export system, ATPase component n=1 Tax=Paramaledivibacter caminithermalis (strain DSM 15212 / CIP 107654 / DViRD3) TaxID=1121301 RepID=A0A1M6P2C5_PARC5|nr:ATP-binding cassette domain-containing protein [Paramaledivibacter caminithermalis]SHK02081.1 ABC-type lipoprotein export system, ATPase component [Paramaledivibacter caminithermalis DSM 15212]
MFNKLMIVGGKDKTGSEELVKELTLEKGNIYTIVGPTGSGKTQLIEDIECLSDGSGLTKRKILLNNGLSPDNYRSSYQNRLVSHLSQNMHFILDMSVEGFLEMRLQCTNFNSLSKSTQEIIECANELSGEKIYGDYSLTKLSGGQSRALMIADVAINGTTPIILIDEIENAGIDRLKAMEILMDSDKIILVVTHDPLLALYGNKRIVMQNGGISKIINRNQFEISLLKKLHSINKITAGIRNDLRIGKELRKEGYYELQSVLE